MLRKYTRTSLFEPFWAPDLGKIYTKMYNELRLVNLRQTHAEMVSVLLLVAESLEKLVWRDGILVQSQLLLAKPQR
jgi:hypothetical protein